MQKPSFFHIAYKIKFCLCYIAVALRYGCITHKEENPIMKQSKFTRSLGMTLALALIFAVSFCFRKVRS